MFSLVVETNNLGGKGYRLCEMVVSIMEDYDECWKWGRGVILYNVFKEAQLEMK